MKVITIRIIGNNLDMQGVAGPSRGADHGHDLWDTVTVKIDAAPIFGRCSRDSMLAMRRNH